MDYKEKYDTALGIAKMWHKNTAVPKECKVIFEQMFPELKENEDERIGKAIHNALKYLEMELSWDFLDDVDILDAYAWLEKQCNKTVDCPQNHQDVKHPNGGIVMVDFNGGEGFYKLHLDYLSKKQVEEVEEMVRTWNKEIKTSNENIINCIGMYLTDANEQRFKVYDTNLKDCLAWLEKQCDNKECDDEWEVSAGLYKCTKRIRRFIKHL